MKKVESVKEIKKNNNVSDFTRGNARKQILGFFWPLLMTSMLQQLYNFVDTMIVGKGLGDNALAAVGNMGSIFFMVIGFSLGLSNGFGILIAQSFGAKNMEMLRRNIAGTIKLAAGITVILTVASLTLLPTALRLLQTDEVIMGDSLLYGYILFGGVATSILYNVTSCMLRSLGDSKTPLKAIIASSLLNLALDSLFIFVLHTGVEGAAIATLIAQVASSIICIRQLRRIEFIRLKKSDFKNEPKLYVNLLKNGLPMAFMNSITAIGCMVVQSFVNAYGVAYTGAYSVCGKYINLFMNPACTAGNAMSAFTSQNYGARNYERIREGLRICVSIALIAYVVLGSVMVFFSHSLATFMLEGSEQIALAEQYFPIAGGMLIFVDLLFVFRSAVQGLGRPLIPMCSGILEMIMRISVIAIFMSGVGFSATAFAEAAAWIAAMLLNLVAFYRILLPRLKGAAEEEGAGVRSKQRPQGIRSHARASA